MGKTAIGFDRVIGVLNNQYGQALLRFFIGHTLMLLAFCEMAERLLIRSADMMSHLQC